MTLENDNFQEVVTHGVLGSDKEEGIEKTYSPRIQNFILLSTCVK
jgi:hypothetical protein